MNPYDLFTLCVGIAVFSALAVPPAYWLGLSIRASLQRARDLAEGQKLARKVFYAQQALEEIRRQEADSCRFR